jgi:hypothetical protein
MINGKITILDTLESSFVLYKGWTWKVPTMCIYIYNNSIMIMSGLLSITSNPNLP